MEPIHAVTYFVPQEGAAFEEAGLRGFWRGYFAGRAAPLGAASTGLVTSVFYGFQPGFVERSIPDVWKLCSPRKAIEARQRGALSGLTAVAEAELGESWQRDSVPEAVKVLRQAGAAAAEDLRPLGQANALLPWPDAPLAQLWHGATILREHRGDGHVMALVVHELGPCESTILRAAVSKDGIERTKDVRGWEETPVTACGDADPIRLYPIP